ncbi:hypothetical protein DDP54_10485 [Cellulomonas sp. WB94]|uniref:hypothetical protein n=1 Tax=Cellulomonas sp. WB94 TaxID=2173174 RepID=UPI000D5864C7|nr:hypothetical protein [Cellulomonas sp. WB94]PVU83351.1 hypothetical protein DDP54_10485 [Cellulomonas sp. WB94]
MKRALGACALILAVALSFMTPASAAKLVMTGGQHPSAFSSARCDDAVAATTPATTTTTNVMQLSGIAVACAGLPIAVQLYDSATTATLTGAATVPAAGGSVQLALSGPYTPAATAVISVTIASWPIPTTWSYTAAAVAPGCVVLNGGGNTNNGKSCSLTFGGNTDTSGTSWKLKITVSTTEKNPVTWQATVNFADLARFPFLARYVGESSGGATFAPLPSGFCSSSTRLVTFTGVASSGTATVVGADGAQVAVTQTIEFVGNNTGQITNPVYICP